MSKLDNFFNLSLTLIFLTVCTVGFYLFTFKFETVLLNYFVAVVSGFGVLFNFCSLIEEITDIIAEKVKYTLEKGKENEIHSTKTK